MDQQTTVNAQTFKTVIDSKHRLFNLHIRETLQYKDLILLFVKRDFVSLYKQTILGPAWAVIQPLLSTFVFTIVFGNLAGLATMDIAGNYVLPGFMFYLSGTICWSYFSLTLQTTSATFLSNSSTMGKVYYPRIVAPISTAFSKLISFGIQFAMMLLVYAFFLIRGGTSLAITPRLLLVPLTVLQMMVLSVGFGTIISAVTTKYRDMQMLVGFGLQLWQYASPVAYGLKLISDGGWSRFMGLYMLNPVTPIITTFRYGLFGFGYFDLKYYLISWAVSLVIFFIGLILFSRIERTFMDTI